MSKADRIERRQERRDKWNNAFDENPGESWGAILGGPLGRFAGRQYDKYIGDPMRDARSSMDKYLEDMMAYAQEQRAEGEALRTEAGEMPKYEIPESMNQVLSIMQSLGNIPTVREMPGKAQYEQRLASDTAARLGAIKEMGGGGGADIGALADMGVENRNRMQDISIESARIAQDNEMQRSQIERQNQMVLAGAYGEMAGYEDQAWNLNQLAPWEQKMNRADNLEFSGDANYWTSRGNQAGVANQRAMNAQDRLFQLIGFGTNLVGNAITGGASAVTGVK